MRYGRGFLGVLGIGACIAAGCSPSAQLGPTAPRASASPGPSASAASSVPATPTPTPLPTPTPTPIPIPSGATPQTLCAISSSSLNGSYPPVPGNYTLMLSAGTFAGSTYAQTEGEYAAISVSATTAPSMTPTPIVTSTPVSSATPSYSYNVYTGNFSVPAYSVTPGPSASAGATPIAVSASSGCFLIVDQTYPTPGPTASGSITGEAVGIPFDENALINGTLAIQSLAYGTITTFDLSSLSPSGGSGSFTFDNGVVGSFTVGSVQVFTESKLRKAEQMIRSRFGLRRR